MLLILGILIFVLVFYCIITEKVPSCYATMLGALIMSFCGIITEEEILQTIHSRLDILLLLIGMMMIVSFISETGLFQWFAIRVVKLVRGEPLLLLILLSLITAISSAFLDNVTTILLMAPISILLAKQLQLDPFPFVMTEVLSSDIGGMATLIGDPTQLIIGSEGHLSFNEFLWNTAPMTIIALTILLVSVYFLYIRKMKVPHELRAQIMELESSRILKNKKLLTQSLFVLILVILGFVSNNFVNKGLSVIALSGAFVLAFISKRNPKEIFEKIEWDTLFFFIGLFSMIRGIENLGIINVMGEKILEISTGNFHFATLSVMWFSSLCTSILGNVANAATFSKIIQTLLPNFENIQNTKAFWWALSFGSCLGGSITMIGSATNIVAVATAKKSGCKIDFITFMKFGCRIAIINLIVASLYLYLRY